LSTPTFIPFVQVNNYHYHQTSIYKDQVVLLPTTKAWPLNYCWESKV